MPTDDYQVDYHAIKNSEVFTIVIGTISIFFPLSVVIILILRYEKLMKGRTLIHYVFMISIADTIICIFIAIGYPKPETLTCATQAFILYFFSRASWFWTDILIFQLLYVIVYKKYFLNIKANHLIVWIVNLILQFIPYSTGTAYGQDDDGLSGTPIIRCGMNVGTGTYYQEEHWISNVYQIELIVSFVFIVLCTVTILIYCYRKSKVDDKMGFMISNIQSTWTTVILYPMGMLITYVPSTVYSHYENRYFGQNNTRAPDSYVIRNYLQASNFLYGVILALIFYIKTESAFEEWKDIIKNIFNSRTMADLEEIRINGLSISESSSNKTTDSTMSMTSESIKVRVSLAFQNPLKRLQSSFQSDIANPIYKERL